VKFNRPLCETGLGRTRAIMSRLGHLAHIIQDANTLGHKRATKRRFPSGFLLTVQTSHIMQQRRAALAILQFLCTHVAPQFILTNLTMQPLPKKPSRRLDRASIFNPSLRLRRGKISLSGKGKGEK